MSKLVLSHVSKYFSIKEKREAPLCALYDVNFQVTAGEYVCLLGRSGCGKSTLLNILAGLEKPDTGDVLLDGFPLEGPDRHRMLMFQEAALFPWLDVMGNVLYGLQFVPELTEVARKERAKFCLELVGLSHVRSFRIHELSGGMRQRVALARALAPEPDILLMDEPFSALDAITREQLYEDMQQIWQVTGKTVFMVTHNVREAVCLGSRVILMDTPGRLISDNSIHLPYPRCMNDPALSLLAANIASVLHGS